MTRACCDLNYHFSTMIALGPDIELKQVLFQLLWFACNLKHPSSHQTWCCKINNCLLACFHQFLFPFELSNLWYALSKSLIWLVWITIFSLPSDESVRLLSKISAIGVFACSSSSSFYAYWWVSSSSTLINHNLSRFDPSQQLQTRIFFPVRWVNKTTIQVIAQNNISFFHTQIRTHGE